MVYVRKVQYKKVEDLREKSIINNMKKITETRVSLMVLLVFVFTPLISHAQLNSILIGETTTNQGSIIDAEVDTLLEIEQDINLKNEVNADINIDVENGLINNIESESNSNSNVLLKINSSGVAVLSSSQVNSVSDLDVFSSNIKAKEKEVTSVNINSLKEGETEVKVVYRHKGKLLGLIPVAINSTTVVETRDDAETEVRSNLSWWSFLVTDQNYTKADIESSIKNNNTIKANAEMNSSAQAKAQVAEVVIAEVKANANAKTKIDK